MEERATFDDEALATQRFGLRFVREDVEAAYLVWHRDQAVPFVRIGMYGCLFAWICVLEVVWLGWAQRGVAGSALITLPISLIVASLATTYIARFRSWMLPLSAFANAIAGMVVILLFGFVLEEARDVPAAFCVSAFFAFAVFRLRPPTAVIVVAPYALFGLWLIVREWRAGRLSAGAALFGGNLMLVAIVSGLLVCVVLDSVARSSFRQEHTIANQRRLLAEERAKSESLLVGLVRQQVAARSRELTELLARVTLPTLPFAPRPGDRIAGHYCVVKHLGNGGMGSVWEVIREADGASFALKLVTSEMSGSAAARLTREAEIGTKLTHPNVLQTVDVGLAPSGHPFVVTELVRGGSLEARRASFGDARFALSLLLGIARGLGALHAAGVVHRDLKPSNVLVADDGPKIADFGISRLDDRDDEISAESETIAANAASPRAQLTEAGVVLGTPLYMPPEAILGGERFGASGDVFSYGVMALEMLAGEYPFEDVPLRLALSGSKLKPRDHVLEAIRARAPGLVELLLACIAQRADERPSIAEVERALARETR